jgi:acyl-homoserine-lactone acylase
MFTAPGMAQPLKQAIAALPAAEQAKAREALGRLMALTASSADLGRRGAV